MMYRKIDNCDDMYFHVSRYGVGEKQKVPFSCKYCKKDFYGLEIWLRHSMIHKSKSGKQEQSTK